jgi:hypothetical protein
MEFSPFLMSDRSAICAPEITPTLPIFDGHGKRFHVRVDVLVHGSSAGTARLRRRPSRLRPVSDVLVTPHFRRIEVIERANQHERDDC